MAQLSFTVVLYNLRPYVTALIILTSSHGNRPIMSSWVLVSFSDWSIGIGKFGGFVGSRYICTCCRKWIIRRRTDFKQVSSCSQEIVFILQFQISIWMNGARFSMLAPRLTSVKFYHVHLCHQLHVFPHLTPEGYFSPLAWHRQHLFPRVTAVRTAIVST